MGIFLVALYSILALPFLIWHERHLPLSLIFLLTLLSLSFSAILFFLSLHFYSKILEHGFHPLYEGIVIAGFLSALSITGFLENNAGRIFLILFSLLTFFIRFARLKLYYSLCMLAMLFLANGMLSFYILQRFEILTSYHLFKSRFQFHEVDLSDWKWQEESRTLTNRSIPIQLRVPEGMFFHDPRNLRIKEKTGIGQIAGILAYSEKDPNSYPYVRVFFFPVYVAVSPSQIREEMIRFNEFLIRQGEIEDVNEIQPNREFLFRGKIPPNAFWTFYDILRPRFSKTGYYLLESVTGSRILLHITENLEKGAYHEPVVQEILDSLVLE